MADFKESFRKGIEAAQIAENNRREIRSVLKALDDQLCAETGGNLKFRIQEKKASSGNAIIDFLNRPFPQRVVIEAYNPKAPNSPSFELCDWMEGPNGYPCRISRGANVFTCEDKEALETALGDLLENSTIARRLTMIRDFKEVAVTASQECARSQDIPQGESPKE